MSIAWNLERALELDAALRRRREANRPYQSVMAGNGPYPDAWEPWWQSCSHWGMHMWPSAEGKSWAS